MGRLARVNELHRTSQIWRSQEFAALSALRFRRSDQNPTSAECLRRQHVAQSISYPPAAREIESKTLGRLLVQQWPRLPALTWSAQFREMGAEVMSIYTGSFHTEELIEASLGFLVLLQCQQSARDPGLVGDNDDKQISLIEPADSSGCTWQQPHLCWIVQVTWVFNDGAVPIQKDGRAALPASIAQDRRAHEE
jgi:hypothetical protein